MTATTRTRRSGGLLLAVVILASGPPLCSGCFLDLLGICGGASEIAKTLDTLPDKVREAAEKVLDQLFNEDLPHAVDKITAASEQLLDRGEKDFEAAVNATRQQLEALAKAVVQDCEELAKDITKDVEEIVATVMKDVLQTVQTILADIDTRVNQLLSRLEKVGQELFCAATGFLDNFEHSLSSFFQKQDCRCVQEMLQSNPGLEQDCRCTSCFHIGGVYPSCPCNPWGMKFGPDWYNRGKYQFAKCHLEGPIDYERWTVDQIVNQLSIIQEMSLSFRCLEDLQPGSTANREYFGDEFTNISHTILVYRSTRGAKGHARRIPRQPALAKPVPASAHHVLQAAGGCDGMTMPQCITQALAELETAKQDAKAQEDEFLEARRQLAADIKANAERIEACNTSIALLTTNVGANSEKIEANAESIGANSKKIEANAESIGDLQARKVGLCGCQSWDPREAVPDGYLLQDYTGYCSPDGCEDEYYSIGGGDDDGIYICAPCMDGDSSLLALPKKKQHCSARGGVNEIHT